MNEANDLFRLLDHGINNPDWAEKLHAATHGGTSEDIAALLGEAGISSSPDIERALRDVSWAELTALARAFGGQQALIN